MKLNQFSVLIGLVSITILLGLSVSQECDGGRIEMIETGRKMLVRTCSGWALNRLPLVRHWVYNEASKYGNAVEV